MFAIVFLVAAFAARRTPFVTSIVFDHLESELAVGENTTYFVEEGTTVAFNRTIVLDSGRTMTIAPSPGLESSVEPYATFDGGGERSLFSVQARTKLTLRRVILQRGKAEIGGCVTISTTSEVALVRVKVLECKAYVGAAFFLEGASRLVASDSVFQGNEGSNFGENNAGGGVVWLQGASLFETYGEPNRFVDNCHRAVGGVFAVQQASKVLLNATTSDLFLANEGNFGAVFFLRGSSSMVNGANFTKNIAVAAGGVAYVSSSSELAVANSHFEQNDASTGGVVYVLESSTATFNSSTFKGNRATTAGGVGFVTDASSSFAAMSSSFAYNRARDPVPELPFGGDVLYVQDASTSQLYNVTLRNQTKSIRCSISGTVYAALLDFQPPDGIQLDAACVLYLYLSNNDGSTAFRDDFLESGVIDRRDATVSHVYWTVPCGPGQFSPDGVEHSDTLLDKHHLSINANDPTCNGDNLPTCVSGCQTCPNGTYVEFTLDRFRHVGDASCKKCPPGRYLDDGGSEAWWQHDELADCVDCPAGRSNAGGTSLGATSCQPCDIGQFQAKPGQPSCKACPSPMTTKRNGSVSCDACLRSYFWNTYYEERNFDRTREDDEDQCARCCERCEEICADEDDCVKCDEAGARLEALEVKAGFWRRTNRSLDVYQCDLDDACRGTSSTVEKNQCAKGHRGALCGACDAQKRFRYDPMKNRCVRCSQFSEMAKFLALVVVCFLLLVLTFYTPACGESLKHHARACIELAADLGVVEHVHHVEHAPPSSRTDGDFHDAAADPEETKMPDGAEAQRFARREHFHSSVRTKAKIIVGTLQIASSTSAVRSFASVTMVVACSIEELKSLRLDRRSRGIECLPLHRSSGMCDFLRCLRK